MDPVSGSKKSEALSFSSSSASFSRLKNPLVLVKDPDAQGSLDRDSWKGKGAALPCHNWNVVPEECQIARVDLELGSGVLTLRPLEVLVRAHGSKKMGSPTPGEEKKKKLRSTREKCPGNFLDIPGFAGWFRMNSITANFFQNLPRMSCERSVPVGRTSKRKTKQRSKIDANTVILAIWEARRLECYATDRPKLSKCSQSHVTNFWHHKGCPK